MVRCSIVNTSIVGAILGSIESLIILEMSFLVESLICCPLTNPESSTPKYTVPRQCLFNMAAIASIASFFSPVVSLNSTVSLSEPITILVLLSNYF